MKTNARLTILNRSSPSSYRRLLVIVTVVLIASLGLAACGDDDEQEQNDSATGISVSDAWARTTTGDRADAPSATMSPQMATPADMSDGSRSAAFMTIHNAGNQVERLIRAEATVADTVEIHETTMTDGVMRMRPLDGLDIPPDGDVVLAPRGLHLMLIGLTRDLESGDTIDLVLLFDSGLRMEIGDVEVREP